jgi:hypothetical protein
MKTKLTSVINLLFTIFKYYHMKKILLPTIFATCIFSNTSAQWKLTGNAGTNPINNFLGTTDANSLVFKVNNTRAGLIEYSTCCSGTRNTSFGLIAFNSNTTGADNTATGYGSLYTNSSGNNNSAYGKYALFNNTANDNSAYGFNAMFSNGSGSGNTAIGTTALQNNTSGSNNVAVGNYALGNNITGSNNTAIGFNAQVGTGAVLTNATAIGSNATVDISNAVVLGNNANVGIGTTSPSAPLHIVGAASNNTLNVTTAGTVNDPSILLARNSGANDRFKINVRGNGGSSWLSIWDDTHGSPDNGINVKGNNVGIGTKKPAYKLEVNGSAHFGTVGIDGQLTAATFTATTGYGKAIQGYSLGPDGTDAYGVYGSGLVGVYGTSKSGQESGIGVYGEGYEGVYGVSVHYAGYFDGDVYSTGDYNSSDRKLKQNIKDFTSAMSIINELHPTQYEFRQDGNYKLMNLPAGRHYGLIAQDVEKVLPNLIKETKFDPTIAMRHKPGIDSNNNIKDSIKADVINFKALNYTELIPIIIKGMQELSAQNDSLKKENTEMRSEIENIKAMIVASQQSVINQQSTIISSASLGQNTPNPFTHTTNIAYSLNQKFTSAQIVITDKTGRTIKAITVSGGKGNVTVDASTLSSGAYQYSLIVDGRLIDTKQMILAK